MRKVLLLVGIMIIMGLTNTFAQAPNTILYQGRLTNADGQPIRVQTGVSFGIYVAPTGGTALWAISDNVSPDENGVFTYELGPIPVTVFDGSQRYLGLTVEGDAEMEPRQLLTSTPYSITTEAVPGIASSYNSMVSLTGTTTAIDSATITVPTSGYVLVQACGYFHMTHTSGAGDQVTRASVDDVRHNMNFSNFAYSRIESGDVTGNYAHSWAVMMTESVSAGTHKYFVNADCYVASGWHPANSECSDTHIVVTFFPTDYGSVVNTKANLNVDPNSPDGIIRNAQDGNE